jgi:hypothetical protein
MSETFFPGQYIVYRNGDRYERGRIKRIHPDGDKAWVWYHAGDTAALTRFEDLVPYKAGLPLINAHIRPEDLGGEDAKEMQAMDDRGLGCRPDMMDDDCDIEGRSIDCDGSPVPSYKDSLNADLIPGKEW